MQLLFGAVVGLLETRHRPWWKNTGVLVYGKALWYYALEDELKGINKQNHETDNCQRRPASGRKLSITHEDECFGLGSQVRKMAEKMYLLKGVQLDSSRFESAGSVQKDEFLNGQLRMQMPYLNFSIGRNTSLDVELTPQSLIIYCAHSCSSWYLFFIILKARSRIMWDAT